jgi:hypothetical protein
MTIGSETGKTMHFTVFIRQILGVNQQSWCLKRTTVFDGDTMGYVPNMIISDSEGDDMIMEGFHQQRHGGIKSAIFNGIYSGNF